MPLGKTDRPGVDGKRPSSLQRTCPCPNIRGTYNKVYTNHPNCGDCHSYSKCHQSAANGCSCHLNQPGGNAHTRPQRKTYKFSGIRLVIPSSLARNAESKVVPAVSSDKNQAWLVAPQFVQITLAEYAAPKGSFLTPEILVYPSQDYAAVNPGAKAKPAEAANDPFQPVSGAG